jgi:hypothetical protein
MEWFGKLRQEWFKGFLELPHGIPDEETFRRLFERLEPAELQRCLQTWLFEIKGEPKNEREAGRRSILTERRYGGVEKQGSMRRYMW